MSHLASLGEDAPRTFDSHSGSDRHSNPNNSEAELTTPPARTGGSACSGLEATRSARLTTTAPPTLLAIGDTKLFLCSHRKQHTSTANNRKNADFIFMAGGTN